MTLYGKRIRAARCYAGLSQQQLGEALGLGKQTIIRREADEQQPSPGERIAISQITGVPLAFLEHGFAETVDEPADAGEPTDMQLVLDALAAHDQRITGIYGGLIERLDQVARALKPLAEPKLQELLGDLDRLVGDDRRTPEAPGRTVSPRARDDRSGTG
jgi:transcriptional regulator with XRE-family HTH domain